MLFAAPFLQRSGEFTKWWCNMMKEIQFWVTLTLLVLAAGFITYRQFQTKDASLQEIPKMQKLPEISQEIPSETAGTSVLSTEMTSAVAIVRTEETQTETPGTENADAVYNAAMPWLPAEKIADIRSRLDALSDLSEDLIGWLYVADTDIDYPVVILFTYKPLYKIMKL
jgi:hypothetical protein